MTRDNRPLWISLLQGTMILLCLVLGSLHGLIDFNDAMQKPSWHTFSWFDAIFNTAVAIFMLISAYAMQPFPTPTKRWEKNVLRALTSRAFILYFAGSGICYCAQAIAHDPIHVLDEKGLRTVGMTLALFILRRRQRHSTYDEIKLMSEPVTNP